MRIVHNAMRRDLARARAVLSHDLAPDDRQRHAIATHLTWMMATLHHHHEGEDAGLYPMVRRRNAEAAALLDGDGRRAPRHRRHDDRPGEGCGGLRERPDGGGGRRGTIDELESTLLPHLRREEDEMMPVVAATITQREWSAWDQQYYVKPLAPLALAKNGLWIIDDLSPEDEAVADPTRVGEWSHECRGVDWLDDAQEAAVGARFRGRNRSGRFGWSRPCTITHLEPGRSLGWRTASSLGDSSEWRVDVDPDDDGTHIVQQYRVLSMPIWLDRLIWHMMPEHRDRERALRQDLERLGDVAARSQSQTST